MTTTSTSAPDPLPEAVLSYTILRTPGSAADTFTIHHSNDTLSYHGSKISHKLSSDEWVISATPNSEALASAKIKASTRECKIRMGKKGDWETVQAIDELATAYAVGTGLVWERLRHDPSSGDITELPHGHMNLHSSDGSLLAIYYRHSEGMKNADGKVEVGKLDFFSTALGETEELHALIAVLGLTECRAMDEKNRNLPLKSGIFPNFIPGPIGYKY